MAEPATPPAAGEAGDEGAPLLLDRDGPAAVVTISRPERLNAVTFAMFARLPALLAEAAELPGVRVAGAARRRDQGVLRGRGHRRVRRRQDHPGAGGRATTRRSSRPSTALAGFPMPTIAAVHGYCYGGGCGLALACDIRLAARAARFAITPAKLGLVYPLRSTKRLVDAVGPSPRQDHPHGRGRVRRRPGRCRSAWSTRSSTTPPPSTPASAKFSGAACVAVRGDPARGQADDRRASWTGCPTDDESHAALGRSPLSASPDYAQGVRAFLEGRSPPVRRSRRSRARAAPATAARPAFPVAPVTQTRRAAVVMSPSILSVA